MTRDTYRVTFIDGPLDGQTRDLAVVPVRLGDYFWHGNYRYDPEGRLNPVTHRHCRVCGTRWVDDDDPIRQCPRCNGAPDEITTLYRGKRPDPRPGPPPT